MKTAADSEAPTEVASPAAPSDTSEAAEPLPGSSSLALGQSAVDGDNELEHGFFTRGLSDEALQAVSDREGERDFLHQPGKPGRNRKISLAACGVLVLVAVVFGVRGFFTERDFRPSPETPTMASLKQAQPSAPPTPQSIESMPLELVPPVTAVPRIVSVSELRVRVPEGPMPPPEAPVPTAEELVAAETPLPVSPSPVATAPSAETPAAADSRAATPTSTQPVAASAAQQRVVSACTDVLRTGKFRDIDSKCRVAFAAAPAAELAAGVAQAALENGRNADAAAWARKAIGVDPKLAQAFALLGGAEQQLGRSAEAKAAYSRYLELAPDGEHAQDIRALLPQLTK
jgi:hypothetical protein